LRLKVEIGFTSSEAVLHPQVKRSSNGE
jgi:hypothetical protein